MSKKCICKEMKDENPWASVTFTCPKHGKVTIDSRLVIGTSYPTYYPTWWYQPPTDIPPYVQPSTLPSTLPYMITCGDLTSGTSQTISTSTLSN